MQTEKQKERAAYMREYNRKNNDKRNARLSKHFGDE